jgi:predicted nucleic acid-binding protein
VAAKFTLDTNVLLYAVDSSEGAKHTLAATILLRAASSKQPLMLQSLNEFSNVVRRKKLMSLEMLNGVLADHRNAFTLQPSSVDDLLDALRANEEHNLPLWDALFWATARRAGCRIILSEDFQDGRDLGGVRFNNPVHLPRRELLQLTS